MRRPGEDVRCALIRQWQLIADAVPQIELSAPSRIDGWRNREVLAHLYVQPRLLARFLQSASDVEPEVGATENLAGTRTFKDLIDSSAREGAVLDKFDLGVPLAEARTLVLGADLDSTIGTLQGSISVSDYLITRCVEAVVHGGDLVDPVVPDEAAQSITSAALSRVLSVTAPELVAAASALPIEEWIDVATGRIAASGPLAAATPVMA
jgi:Mycothiol maleylpyruvate isomerase N-terminal domain